MKKKIGLITALSIVVVLAITTITLAFVNVSNAPSFQNPYEIRAYESGNSRPVLGLNSNETDEALKKKYQEFMNEYNKMFDISVLSGIFSGNLGTLKVEDKFKSQTPVSGNKIIFDYSNSPVQLKINGKDYYSSYNPDEVFMVYDISFQITKEDKYQEIIFVVRRQEEKTSGSTTTYENFYLEIKTMANTHKLYEFLYGKDEEK